MNKEMTNTGKDIRLPAVSQQSMTKFSQEIK